MSEIDQSAATPGAPSPSRRPVTVILGVALLAVSIGWWLVELPMVVAGLVGPGELDGFVLLSVVLVSLPALLELVGAVLVWMRFGRGKGLLVVVALYSTIRLIGSFSLLLAVDLALVIGSLVLFSRPASRDWFAGRRSTRR